jgi:hypothetical protein
MNSKVIMLVNDKTKVGPGTYEINDSLIKSSPRVIKIKDKLILGKYKLWGK